jgi:hypothetical protein
MGPFPARRARRPGLTSRKPFRERHLLHPDLDRVLRHRRGLRLFLREGALTPVRPPPFPMETIIIGLIALACLAYLVVAVLRPEWF